MMGRRERIELFRRRREARIARWQLPQDQRDIADQMAAEIWTMAPNVEIAEEATRERLETLRESGDVRFDPLTILAIIQVCVAIYKLLKELGVLGGVNADYIALALDEETSGDE